VNAEQAPKAAHVVSTLMEDVVTSWISCIFAE
jgi:hypothetical protein